MEGLNQPSEDIAVSSPIPDHPAQRILVIDGDLESVRLLNARLLQAGFHVTTIDRSADAVAAIAREHPHLVMLDWDLPGVVTMQVVQHINRHGGRGPRLIALSAFSGEQHVVSGLEVGVDDYVVKPYSIAEVIARVRAVLRATRSAANDDACFEFGRLCIDTNDARVTVLHRRVLLRSLEYRLLEFLARHPGRAFQRETLLQRVWGSQSVAEPRAVDVTVQRIRRALEPHGCHGYLQTIRGVGYRLSCGDSAAG